MDQLYKPESNTNQPPYHVIPDNARGGWLVYVTTDPQEPQVHFNTRDDAVDYAEKMSLAAGVGFMVESYEARGIGI